MQNSDLKIEVLPVDVLKMDDRNARKHEKKDIDTTASSIKKYGFNDPIGIWGKDNLIVEGHGRLLACKQLGITEVPCIRLDHLTEQERREYAIMHNKTAEISMWDYDILKQEIEELKFDDIPEIDWELPEIGFDLEPETIQEDDFNGEPPEEPICQKGDIWQLGDHRLMCGDSTNGADVALLMNGDKADMVFTDPPYGYNYRSNMRTKSNKFDVIENDDKILDFFPLLKDVAKGFIFICTTWKVLDKWLPLFKNNYELSNMIIWDKGGGGIGDLEHTFSTDYEIILCSNNGNKITGKRIGSVWEVGKDNANNYQHPTQKPVGLSAMAIKNTTNKGEKVLDLFGGSGSTLIACEQLHRKCYMMELDNKYCDVIINRWQTLTGKKAVKL